MNCRVLVFFSCVLFTLVFSLVPVPEVKAPGNTDKVVHFLMYFMNALFFWFAFRKEMESVLFRALVFSILFGAFVEVLQFFTPYRSLSLLDILANSIGALCAGIFLHYGLNRRLSMSSVSTEEGK